MNPPMFSFSFLLLISLICLYSSPTSAQTKDQEFLRCLSLRSNDASRIVFTRNNTSFSAILNSSIQNRRFSTIKAPKPLVIVTPLKASHVQETIRCSRRHDLQIRTRSGGHDYEGLSYISEDPFVIIDLRNLRSISIDAASQKAKVESGATIGQLYYAIAEKSKTLAFPAGVYPTVGIGGLFSGGGYGTLLRNYGLAVDNIIDAYMIDVEGRFLDRASMGEDLFWAIRGGGGASFGVILAWKIKLVRVPSTVTVFNIKRSLEQNATSIIHRWQYIADKLPQDLFVRVVLKRADLSDQGGGGIVKATFPSLYLGTVPEFIPLIEERFPELGVTKKDCMEMSWIQSVLYFAGFSVGEPIQVLGERTTESRSFKGKSDYVQNPMPEYTIEEIWKRFEAPEAKLAKLILTPFGGKMSEISESHTPFPHRAGNIYEIQHLVYWEEDGTEESGKYMNWLEKLYDFVTPYVSKSPRAAYYNFRDIDLGRNGDGKSDWGLKYFKNNFERLIRVKTTVDPTDFFRNEQSIRPLNAVDDLEEVM